MASAPPPPLPQGYHPIRLLGKGAYGEVWQCFHVDASVAVKVLVDQSAIEHSSRELEALSALVGNRNVLQLIETVISDKNDPRLFIVTEYAQGGDLLHYMQRNSSKPMSEDTARKVFRQLVSGLASIHESGWVHRDIKLENILLASAMDPLDRVIIGDFGFATRWSADSYLRESYGSLHYSSPEIITAQPYIGPEVDVWSLGVVLYALCFGRLPFGAANESELAERIMSGIYNTPSSASADLIKLLAMMLHPSAKERATLHAIMNCSWLKDEPAIQRSGSLIGVERVPAPRRNSLPLLFRRLAPEKNSSIAESNNEEREHINPLHRLSRYTLNGVKRFSLTRLLRLSPNKETSL